mgnify:CR=1 FL=1
MAASSFAAVCGGKDACAIGIERGADRRLAGIVRNGTARIRRAERGDSGQRQCAEKRGEVFPVKVRVMQNIQQITERGNARREQRRLLSGIGARRKRCKQRARKGGCEK